MMVTDDMTFIVFFLCARYCSKCVICCICEGISYSKDKPSGTHTTEDYFSLTSSSISSGNGGQKSHCSTKSLKGLG